LQARTEALALDRRDNRKAVLKSEARCRIAANRSSSVLRSFKYGRFGNVQNLLRAP